MRPVLAPAALCAVLGTALSALLPVAAPAVVSAALSVSLPAVPVPGSSGVVVRYAAPVPLPLRVIRVFDPPAGPYGPGHLGVDLAASAGMPVLAAADGSVTFAGSVAGRGVVVVTHADGVRTEYEPVRPLVHAGARVRRGDRVGTLAGRHTGCPGTCLHWGARRGTVYLDPLRLLRPLGPVRLLPWPRAG